MNYATDFVEYALSIRAIELVPEGRKLKSGRVSPYFFNSGLFNTGCALHHLSIAYHGVIFKYFYPDVIFGLSYKGSAIAVAVTQQHGSTLGYAYDRKEAKDHGEGGTIGGMPLKGKQVVIVDDVITTGESLIEAMDIVRRNGGIPIGCVIAFDRQERDQTSDFSAAWNFERNHKIPLRAVANLDSLITVLKSKDPDILEKVLDYKKRYGA